jgi:hypothetical protein
MVRLATPLTAIVAAIIWPLKWLGRRRPSGQADGPEAVPPSRGGVLAPQIDRAIEWLSRTEERPDPCARA